jgi:predicted membrane protein
MPWKKYSLPILIVAILLVGIVLELFGSKLAFFVNAGVFLLAAGYAVDVLVHAGQEPEARIFGWFLGMPALLVLVIDVLLYSGKMRARRASLRRSVGPSAGG